MTPSPPCACLLVHGLHGTTYDMQDLTAEIQALGIPAEALLLPGHDVLPAVAQRFGWEDWIAAIVDAVDRLAARYGRVILIGHSMGGALALSRCAADPRIAAVATLCAPAVLHAGLVPLMRHSHRWLPFLPKIFEDIRDHQERWRYLVRRRIWYVPTKPIYSLLLALPQIRERLPQITCPALIISARNDHVVPVRDGRYIFEHIGSQEKEYIVLRHSWHVVTRDLERDLVSLHVLGFVRRMAARLAVTAADPSLTTSA